MNAVIARVLDFWAREPAIVTQAATQVVALLVAFNVPVTDQQRAAIVGLVEVVGAIVSALVIRGQVYSPATVTSILAEQAAPPLPTTPVPNGSEPG